MQRLKSRSAALLGTTALLAGFGVAAGQPAGAAPAPAPCDYRAYANNSSAWGYYTGTYRLRSRPAAECAEVSRDPAGTKFYIWCAAVNYYGNVWVYGRLAGTETRGWQSGDNVTYEGGSLNNCP